MKTQKDFMLLFRLQPAAQQPTAEEINVMRQQWESWIGNIAAQARLVSTTRLGFDGRQIDNKQSITEGLNMVNAQIISGNMILKAANIDEAAEIAKTCPVLNMGGSVEVRDTIPM